MGSLTGESSGWSGAGRRTCTSISASGLARAADVLCGAATLSGCGGERALSFSCGCGIVCAGALWLAGVVHRVPADGMRKHPGGGAALLAAGVVEERTGPRSRGFVARGPAGELVLRAVAVGGRGGVFVTAPAPDVPLVSLPLPLRSTHSSL